MSRLLVLMILCFTPSRGTAQDRQPIIRVAIYDHSDEMAKGPRNLLRFLVPKYGFRATRVSPEEIRNKCLAEYDVLIMPGGSGSLQSKKLEESGRENVRSFVREGGGYVGICAGSYLASSHYSWSLGLINARVWDRAHWARGTGTVNIRLTGVGRNVLGMDKDSVEVYYGQGPLLVPDNETSVAGLSGPGDLPDRDREEGSPAGGDVRYARDHSLEIWQGPRHLFQSAPGICRWSQHSDCCGRVLGRQPIVVDSQRSSAIARTPRRVVPAVSGFEAGRIPPLAELSPQEQT